MRHGPDGLAALAPAAVAGTVDPRSPATLLRDVGGGAWLVLLAPQASAPRRCARTPPPYAA